MISRITPPPVAVTNARILIPNISMPLRAATAAPERAKAIVPIISIISINVKSKLI